jgi:hypothetical protein
MTPECPKSVSRRTPASGDAFAAAQGAGRAQPGEGATNAHCVGPAGRAFPGEDSQDAPFGGQVYLCTRRGVRDSGHLNGAGRGQIGAGRGRIPGRALPVALEAQAEGVGFQKTCDEMLGPAGQSAVAGRCSRRRREFETHSGTGGSSASGAGPSLGRQLSFTGGRHGWAPLAGAAGGHDGGRHRLYRRRT